MEVSQTGLSWQWTARKRRRHVMDIFFEDGDKFCCYSVKQLPLETITEEEDVRRYTGLPAFHFKVEKGRGIKMNPVTVKTVPLSS